MSASTLDALADQLSEPTRQWLQDSIARATAAPETLPRAFSLAHRQGAHPAQREALRCLLLVRWASGQSAEAVVACCDELARFADLNETIALYRSLPHLPHAPALVPRAREGLRSNIQAVFAAVACESDFPARHFDPDAWNQMILKAFFLAVDTRRIPGCERRHNQTLAQTLAQYAAERRSAGRAISPQLWRFIGPQAGASELALLAEALASHHQLEQAAAQLALSSCPLPEARTLLRHHPPCTQTWSDIPPSL